MSFNVIKNNFNKSFFCIFSQKNAGFTLVEILMVIILVGILSAVSVSVLNDSVDDGRFDETLSEMRTIRDAVIGNQKLREGGTRTSFGYFGDVGAMPAVIGDLTTIPAGVTAWVVDSAERTSYGWNGPYLSGGDSGADYTTDAWGTAYVYTPGAVPPTLVSLGADRAVGGTELNQDITINMPATERLATVEGFVSDSGGPYTGDLQIELNYSSGTGGLNQAMVTKASPSDGHFSFASVPFGVRSITVYQGTKAVPISTVGPVVITVDRPNVMVPANQLDINP